MKDISISELKAHLSRYLRLVRRGERIRVRDRQEVVAELGPVPAESSSVWTRLTDDGRMRAGSQDWASLKISPTKKRVPIQQLLDDVRADSR